MMLKLGGRRTRAIMEAQIVQPERDARGRSYGSQPAFTRRKK